MKERLSGIVGLVCAVLAVVADLAMQYTPDLSHVGSSSYAYLLDVSPHNLLLGHFLGVPAVLGEIAGFWFISSQFLSGHRVAARLFLWPGVVAFSLGAAFHAMFAPIGLALQRVSSTSPALVSDIAAAVRPAHQGLGVPILLGILLYSIVFAWATATGRTRYPRWIAVCSPLVFLVLAALVIRGFPSLRAVLLPCALNAANVLLFASAVSCRPRMDGRSAIRPPDRIG